MTPEENDEFNRIEMESRIKQEYVRAIKENHEKHVKEHLEFDALMRKTTREEKISRPAVYEVPTVQFVSISMEDYVEITQKLALARIQIKKLEERIKEMEKNNG